LGTTSGKRGFGSQGLNWLDLRVSPRGGLGTITERFRGGRLFKGIGWREALRVPKRIRFKLNFLRPLPKTLLLLDWAHGGIWIFPKLGGRRLFKKRKALGHLLGRIIL